MNLKECIKALDSIPSLFEHTIPACTRCGLNKSGLYIFGGHYCYNCIRKEIHKRNLPYNFRMTCGSDCPHCHFTTLFDNHPGVLGWCDYLKDRPLQIWYTDECWYYLDADIL